MRKSQEQQDKKKLNSKNQENNDELKRYYKNRYHIVFYEYDESLDDEIYFAGFDSVREICKFKKLPITTINVSKITQQLCQALKRNNHITRLLGSTMKVYLVDMREMDELEKCNELDIFNINVILK